jgi:hypothetical protein
MYVCMYACLCSLLGRYHEYSEMLIIFLIVICLSMNTIQFRTVHWISKSFFWNTAINICSLLNVASDVPLPVYFKQV